MEAVHEGFMSRMDGIIVSKPESSIYAVVDVHRIAPDNFDAGEFVNYCAEKGAFEIDGKSYTMLVAPMAGFYERGSDEQRSRFQMRIAFVEASSKMELLPQIFEGLFNEYVKEIS